SVVSLSPLPVPSFFFLLLRPPPTSPLFPSTTLFRSRVATACGGEARLERAQVTDEIVRRGIAAVPLRARERAVEPAQHAGHELRSEEHTSELQSRFDLVCRLLLEKKKNIRNNQRT